MRLVRRVFGIPGKPVERRRRRRSRQSGRCRRRGLRIPTRPRSRADSRYPLRCALAHPGSCKRDRSRRVCSTDCRRSRHRAMRPNRPGAGPGRRRGSRADCPGRPGIPPGSRGMRRPRDRRGIRTLCARPLVFDFVRAHQEFTGGHAHHGDAEPAMTGSVPGRPVARPGRSREPAERARAALVLLESHRRSRASNRIGRRSAVPWPSDRFARAREGCRRAAREGRSGLPLRIASSMSRRSPRNGNRPVSSS